MCERWLPGPAPLGISILTDSIVFLHVSLQAGLGRDYGGSGGQTMATNSTVKLVQAALVAQNIVHYKTIEVESPICVW